MTTKRGTGQSEGRKATLDSSLEMHGSLPDNASLTRKPGEFCLVKVERYLRLDVPNSILFTGTNGAPSSHEGGQWERGTADAVVILRARGLSGEHL